ncbi:methyltransferase domain-containing protein [Komarekiella sp. 'clone 1']|uniref:Methyltransferase domain-containing protein n=1 Tax=Komarekiella delphini-convector SJRDD-AB1 TaxID=2593771 RepID=A0AA40T4J0_9NOST|nr:methyltransferase domain-containing protein [Komarekiella delphini-convector SJRDD-AB1]
MSYIRDLAKQILPKQTLPTVMQFTGELQSIWYAGKQYTCPCCGGTFRKLRSGGVNKRQNAVCPKCNSFERHRLLWLYLKNQTNLFFDNLKLLHICPEFFFWKGLNSLPLIQYTAAGLNSPFATLEMDIKNIQKPDNSYDVILCSHVLEHIPEDHKAMFELFRILKPGGWAILQVPLDYERETTFEDFSITSPKDRECFFGKDDHVRVYGLDYKDRLEKAGFTVEVVDYVTQLGEEKIIKYCLPDREDIYLCTK